MIEQRDNSTWDGLGGVVAATAAATVIPVLGAGLALRGAVIGLSRLRRPGGRGAGSVLVALAGLAMLAQLGHAQYIDALMGARERARQTVCVSKLKQIGTALAMYQSEHLNRYPRIANPRQAWPKSYTADPRRHTDSEAFYANEYNCNLQPMWLLVEAEFITPASFKCASDKSYKAPPKGEGWGFDSWYNSSYAFQPFTAHPSNAAWPARSGQDGSVVLAADKQTTADALNGNRNHEKGTNALTYDGAVAFREGSDNAFGWKRNNIYVKDVSRDGEVVEVAGSDLAGKAGELPDHINDSVLFWKEDGDSAPASGDGHEGHDHNGDAGEVYEDDGRTAEKVPDAVGATPPAGQSIWPIVAWCVGIGAVIGVALALWKTARESKQGKQDGSQQ
jgi:hypothetical protein